MRNEHEGNLNILRGVLHACEEGVTDELTDGSEDDEPWTEDDRREARETADWIRRTFFEPAPCECTRPKRKRLLPSETYFGEEQLWDTLDHADDRIRAAAVESMQALTDLAAVRAKQNGTKFLAERRDVFETRRLIDDLRSADPDLHKAARRVFCELFPLQARLDAEAIAVSDELRERARRLVAAARARLAEIDREQTDAERQP